MSDIPAFKVGGRIDPPYFVDREEALQTLVHDASPLAQSNAVHGLVLLPCLRRSGAWRWLRGRLQYVSEILLPPREAHRLRGWLGDVLPSFKT